MVKNFSKRLQSEVSSLVSERYGGVGKNDGIPEVSVSNSKRQRFAVWYGASMLSSLPQFSSLCNTRQEYEEHGPSIFRASKALPCF